MNNFNTVLEILEELEDQYLDEYWSTMKEYRMPLGSKIDKINEAIKEIEYWIAREE